MKLITNAIVTKFVEYFFLWDILPSCDAMLHIVMSCWLLWCHVAYCDVMLVIVMSCWLLQCHVAYCDVMLHIMISCSLFRMLWYTVKVLIFAASNFHGFSQLDKFLGTFFRVFHKTHLIEILHIDHVKNTKS